MAEPSRFTWLGSLRTEVNGLLAADEKALAMQRVVLPMAGANRLGKTAEDDERRLRHMPDALREASLTRATKAPRRGTALDRANHVITSMLTPTWPWDKWDTTRLWAGLIGSGPAGSAAHRIWATIDRHGRGVLMLVTDRRVLLLEVPKPEAERLEQLMELPRHEIARARRRDRLFSHGRLRLDFADGSMVILLPGLISPRPARKLSKALSSG